MQQIIVFSLVGAALYLFSDWALNRIEQIRGRRFEHRSVVFFCLILVLALASFHLLNRMFV